MHTEVEMTLTVSLLLDEMVNTLLNKVEKNEAGEDVVRPRSLPFRLKYRLTRNKATLDKDYKAYQQKQLMLLARFGELTADGEHFEIKDPGKLELYKGNMEAALSTVVKHSVIKLEAEDLENLLEDEDINFSEGMLKILMGYLIDDQAFLDDISADIHWKTYQPEPKPAAITDTVAALVTAQEETTPVEEKTEVQPVGSSKPKKPRKKAEPKAEEKAEEPKAEIPVEEPKKALTKSQIKRKNIREGKPVLEGLEAPKAEEAPKPKKTSTKKPATSVKKTTTTKTATKKAAAKDKTNE